MITTHEFSPGFHNSTNPKKCGARERKNFVTLSFGRTQLPTAPCLPTPLSLRQRKALFSPFIGARKTAKEKFKWSQTSIDAITFVINEAPLVIQTLFPRSLMRQLGSIDYSLDRANWPHVYIWNLLHYTYSLLSLLRRERSSTQGLEIRYSGPTGYRPPNALRKLSRSNSPWSGYQTLRPLTSFLGPLAILGDWLSPFASLHPLSKNTLQSFPNLSNYLWLGESAE